MGVLDGKTAIITGASRGIGSATAREMAREGANLMILARSGDALSDLASELTATGANVQAMTCDISEYSQIDAAVTRTLGVFGQIDILVNNAAIIEPISPIASSDPMAWAQAASTNLNGMYFGIRAVLPFMRERGSGTILNVGTGAAHRPLEGWSVYCSSKAGCHMLTLCTDLENRGSGIRVFSLSPGTVATDMQRSIKASGINAISQMEFSEHAPVEHPARALVWMATEAAADLAGSEISLRDLEIRARIGLD